jgi:putative flippase GtrA
VHFSSFHENIITSIAFITAFWVSFFGHRYFTFKKKGSPVSFFILSISTFLLRNVFVLALVSIDIRGYYALISSMVLVTAITYFVAKFKVFKD